VMPPGARWPEPWRTVRVRVGRPIDVSRHTRSGRPVHDRLVLRQLTDEVMYEIRELSGQEYVDEYATRRSEDLPADPARVSTEVHDRAGVRAAPASEVALERSAAVDRADVG